MISRPACHARVAAGLKTDPTADSPHPSGCAARNEDGGGDRLRPDRKGGQDGFGRPHLSSLDGFGRSHQRSATPTATRRRRRRCHPHTSHGGGFGSEPKSPEPDPRVPARSGSLHHHRDSRRSRGDRPSGHQRPWRDRGRLRRRHQGDHGFMRDRRGRITTIDVPGARGTAAQKINNRGQIAGVYSDTSPDTQVPQSVASCWSAASSPGSMSRTRCKPGPSASTTAVRWWASTPTPTAWSTASCGTRGGSPPSTSPAPPRRPPSTSTIVARSSASYTDGRNRRSKAFC